MSNSTVNLRTFPPRAPWAGAARARGFTLVELMVGMAIAAILLAVGIPSFQRLIASNRLSGATNEVITQINSARMEAIRRGQRVTLCRSANATTNAPTCAGAGDFTQGWVTFTDTTRATANPSIDAGEVVISVQRAMTAGIEVKGSGSAVAFVSFGADGQPKLMNGNPIAAGTRIRVCNPADSLSDDERARDIAIDFTGRVTSSIPAGISGACPA